MFDAIISLRNRIMGYAPMKGRKMSAELRQKISRIMRRNSAARRTAKQKTYKRTAAQREACRVRALAYHAARRQEKAKAHIAAHVAIQNKIDANAEKHSVHIVEAEKMASRLIQN